VLAILHIALPSEGVSIAFVVLAAHINDKNKELSRVNEMYLYVIRF
jgi:hypothetical protein